MKSTRRFAVATLLVLAVVIVLGAPAPASAGKVKETQVKGTQVTLYPTADSPSPNSTGMVTLYQDRGQIYWSAVGVSVSRLAPNASYYMPITVLDPWSGMTSVYNVPIQTDAHGNGKGGWSGYNRGYYYNYWYPNNSYHYNYYITAVTFQVYDASGTLVLTPNP